MEENYNTQNLVENKLYGKTFFWMSLGLLGTAIISAYTYYSGLCFNLISDGYWGGILILELLVVILFSLFFRKLSPVAVGILYFAYSMINGITLSTIFAIFELNSIIYLFIISSLIFAVLGFIGYKTNKDLSKFGTYLMVFLIAGLILSIINLFFVKSTGFDLLLDWVILLVFFGVTVYDINKIK